MFIVLLCPITICPESKLKRKIMSYYCEFIRCWKFQDESDNGGISNIAVLYGFMYMYIFTVMYLQLFKKRKEDNESIYTF